MSSHPAPSGPAMKESLENAARRWRESGRALRLLLRCGEVMGERKAGAFDTRTA